MRDSERYEAQAQAVLRLAARAGNPAEKDVYLSIADGWRRLAAEAVRSERRVDPEDRVFKTKDGPRRCD
jgi:hypothetical protein